MQDKADPVTHYAWYTSDPVTQYARYTAAPVTLCKVYI